jgi:Fe-S oxidoreductase
MTGHCHHKATGGIGGEQKLLEAMGMEIDAPDSGCCRMAGSFGFEAGHYDISMACGERVLLPEVRKASPDALVVADGFSCRTQIEQGNTGRRGLHVAQVLRLAEGYQPAELSAPHGRRAMALGAVGVAAALGLTVAVLGIRKV